MTDLARQLLALIQEGLPCDAEGRPVPRPFLTLGQRLGIGEQQVIALLEQLQAEGVIRELCAFLDPAKLGYSSTLACLSVPPERVDQAARVLDEMPEVTHNYLRDHPWNVWFTVIAPSPEAVQAVLRQVEERTGCGPVHSLPATRVYKLKVAFTADMMSS